MRQFILLVCFSCALVAEGARSSGARAHFERNGYVTVPYDWHQSGRSSIELRIKYRVLSDNPDAPYAIFIGGGPGLSSIDVYSRRLFALLKNYQVVLFDQRGTGESSPVLPEGHGMMAAEVARYYSARQIVHDLGLLAR